MKIKITFNAPVVLGFAAICFIATLLNYLTNGKSNHMIFMTYHSYLMSPLTYLRLFTHVFGHDGGATLYREYGIYLIARFYA